MNFRYLKLCLFVCLFLVPMTILAQNNGNKSNENNISEAIQKEVLQLEELGRQKFLKGDHEWDDILADGAYMTAPDGSITIYQKGQKLPSYPFKSINFTEMRARVYGESTVVTGLASFESETPEKKPISYQMRFLNVWKKFNEGWRIVVTQSTVVKGSFH